MIYLIKLKNGTDIEIEADYVQTLQVMDFFFRAFYLKGECIRQIKEGEILNQKG